MKLLVFLGNPGPNYEYTRHNIGFLVGDAIAKKRECNNRKLDSKRNALITSSFYNKQKIVLAKPQTFMNNSGQAVQAILNFYNISIQDSVIIYDDLDLPPEHTRYKLGWSSGWHNWIKSIIQQLGTQEFAKIKIGIGRPDHQDIVNYVLSKLPQSTLENIHVIAEEVISKLEDHFLYQK